MVTIQPKWIAMSPAPGSSFYDDDIPALLFNMGFAT
jgi:hypothetical protein